MRWIALAACLTLGVGASAAGSSRTAAACPGNLANQLASTGSALQLVTVVAPYRASTQGTLELWQKSGGCWRAYHRIVCGDWWVEDSRSPWYNRFHHVPCGSK